MAELKTNTHKRDYLVTVERDGKIQAAIAVKAEGVTAALKAAYAVNCGWQMTPVEDLEAMGK